IDQAKHFNVPCLLINARLSEKSAQGYAKVAALTHGMLSGIDRLLAQDQATLQRYLELGMAPDKAQILGSIKFDIQAPESFIQQAEVLKQQWNLSKRQVITLASTHAPEEQKLLSALKPYLVDHPELLIIIVPRHPERFDAVFQLAQDLQLTTQRRSLGQRIEADSQVYLADSMGEMWLWYALSCVCFVGGSLNEPGGGHNILEPMALNIPTVIGPNYFNFQTIVDELIKADAILLGQEVNQVAAQLIQCVQQPEQAQRLSEHAAAIMQKNSGSLQKHIQVIDEYLAKKPAF
uniref:3-deoxy-D-manno-octulosonic acid transferase n=1 Tax=Acinetobacter harbinensis TaxID=1353941 RepID=UPI0028ED9E8B